MESAGKAAANGIMLGFGAVLVMIAFGLLGTNWYLRIYTDDPVYRILALPLFVNGVSIVMSQSFPPAKRSYLTMIYTMLRQVGIMIPFCLIGGRIGGIRGIWIGYAATDFVAVLVVLTMTIWFMKNVINKLEKDKE